MPWTSFKQIDFSNSSFYLFHSLCYQIILLKVHFKKNYGIPFFKKIQMLAIAYKIELKFKT